MGDISGDSRLITSLQLQILNEIRGWNGYLRGSTPDLHVYVRECLPNVGFAVECRRMPVNAGEASISPAWHRMRPSRLRRRKTQ